MSFSPIIVKLLGRNILGPISIAFWRTFIGGMALILIAKLESESGQYKIRPYKGFRGERRGEHCVHPAFSDRPLHMAPAPMAWCLFTGTFFALDLALWHYAIIYVGSGMACLLGNTHVFATAVISWLVFKEKLTPRFLVAAPVGIGGLALLVGVFSEKVVFTPLYIRGLVFGFLTALLYSMYLVGIKKASDHKSRPVPAAIMAWICLTAAVFLAVGSFFENKPALPPNFRAVSLLMILGIVGQALSWWGIVHSIKKIAIHHAALILLLQPVLAMVWGYLFFNEALAVSQILGAVITLTAIYAGSIRK
jgi:drug/metabolite transporter (DMT)-like permease